MLQEVMFYLGHMIDSGPLYVSIREWLQKLSDVCRKQDNIQDAFRLVVRIRSASQKTRALQPAVDQKAVGIAQVLFYGCDGTIRMIEFG